jgi:heme-degrading monooxygenase HmoA
MITEVAFMSVHPGQEAEFLAALEQAKQVVARAKGFHSIDVKRGIERPSTFLLTLTWETLEDHTEGFRGGPLFPEWRGHISPFFAEAPQVEHWTAS